MHVGAGGTMECELFLRGAVSAHNLRGYELDILDDGRCLLTRWNGALNDFTPLNSGNPIANFSLATGRVARGWIVGNVITVYSDGASIGSYDLTTNFVAEGSLIWATGSPGLGYWYVDAQPPHSSDLCFSQFTADDGLGTTELIRPFRRGGPGKGPKMRRMLAQRFPDTFIPVETQYPVTPVLGRVHPGGFGPKSRYRLPQRFPEVSQATAAIVPASVGAWSWAGVKTSIPLQVPAKVGAWSWAGVKTSVPLQVPAKVGAWSWAGVKTSVPLQIPAKVGTWLWTGVKTSIPLQVPAKVGAWSWAGVPSSIVMTFVVPAKVGGYTWSGVPVNIPQIAVVNATIGQYSWAGVSVSVQDLTSASKPQGFYGVSYRRKRIDLPVEEIAPEISIAELVRSQVEGRKPEVKVSIEKQGVEEVVNIQVAGVSKRDMDAIIAIIIASEL